MTTEKPARRKTAEKPAQAPEVEAVEAPTHIGARVDEPVRRGSRSVAEVEALLARGCPRGLVEGTDPDAVLID